MSHSNFNLLALFDIEDGVILKGLALPLGTRLLVKLLDLDHALDTEPRLTLANLKTDRLSLSVSQEILRSKLILFRGGFEDRNIFTRVRLLRNKVIHFVNLSLNVMAYITLKNKISQPLFFFDNNKHSSAIFVGMILQTIPLGSFARIEAGIRNPPESRLRFCRGRNCVLHLVSSQRYGLL